MKRSTGIAVLLAISSAALAWHAWGAAPADSTGRGMRADSTTRSLRAQLPPLRTLNPDSVAASRDSIMKALLDRLGSRDSMPADSVFKNIKVMKRVTAGRLLRIMNFGFARSLGVGCDHCHVPGKWALEDKPTKQIARDMSAMVTRINTELLPAIKNLRSESPIVNCTTCHRGEPKPALDLKAR